MTNNIFEISKEDDLIEVLNNINDRLIVLMFSASWCGPCKTIKPEFIKFSKKYNQTLFIYIDIEEYDECKKNEKDQSFIDKVEGLPSFMFYINKNLLTRFEGADKSKLEKYIEKCEQLIIQKNQQNKMQQMNNMMLMQQKLTNNNNNNNNTHPQINGTQINPQQINQQQMNPQQMNPQQINQQQMNPQQMTPPQMNQQQMNQQQMNQQQINPQQINQQQMTPQQIQMMMMMKMMQQNKN